MSTGFNDVTDIVEQIAQVFLGAFTPSQTKRVLALQARDELVHPFAYGSAIPSQLSLRQNLPTGSELPNSLGHKQPTRTALQFGCGALEQGIDAICNMSSYTPSRG